MQVKNQVLELMQPCKMLLEFWYGWQRLGAKQRKCLDRWHGCDVMEQRKCEKLMRTSHIEPQEVGEVCKNTCKMLFIFRLCDRMRGLTVLVCVDASRPLRTKLQLAIGAQIHVCGRLHALAIKPDVMDVGEGAHSTAQAVDGEDVASGCLVLKPQALDMGVDSQSAPATC